MTSHIFGINVGKTMPFLLPMIGNGNHTTYKSGDDWGMVRLYAFMALFYPHYMTLRVQRRSDIFVYA